jgi:hypothetical protein
MIPFPAIPGYTPKQLIAFLAFYSTAIRPLHPHEFYLCGDHAIRLLMYHLGVDSCLIWRAFRPEEVDIGVFHPDSVDAATIRQCHNLALLHYHEEGETHAPYWMILEPRSRTQANVYFTRHPEVTIVEVPVGGLAIPVQHPAHQLAAIVTDALGPTRGEVVDPKQFDDARQLYLLLYQDYRTRPTLEPVWQLRRPPNSGLSLAETIDLLDDIEHDPRYAHLVQRDPHRPRYLQLARRPLARGCEKCVPTAEYLPERTAVWATRYLIGR